MGHSDDEENVTIGQPTLPSPSTVANATSTPVTASLTPSTNIENPTASPIPVNNSIYKDGTFTGSVEDAYYGNIQVQAVIQNGRIVDVIFLQYPNDNRTSIRINAQADPYLKEEAIAAQSANVNVISGASDSSFAFRKSMASALALARK